MQRAQPYTVSDMPRAERDRPAHQYEVKVLTLPRTTSRGEVRRLLTEEAEYGKWELARHRLYVDGGRKVWLRRRIIRVQSTL